MYSSVILQNKFYCDSHNKATAVHVVEFSVWPGVFTTHYYRTLDPVSVQNARHSEGRLLCSAVPSTRGPRVHTSLRIISVFF